MQQKIKIVLQGSVESFEEYERRLELLINNIRLSERVEKYEMIMPMPTSASNGRLNTILIWREKENGSN